MSLFLIALVVAAVYLVSLGVLPWWTCPSCKGAEVSRGRGKAHRRCLRCKGNGRYPRLGVRIFTPARARAMLEGKKGTFY